MTIAAVLLVATPATAKWTVVPAAASIAVAKSALSVTPGAGWNRWSKKPARQSELWSFDGPLLNQLQYYGGIASGMPLARERNRKRDPLPKFSTRMKATEIAEAYEQTMRVTQGIADFTIDTIEPADFAANKGFRFAFHYTAGELSRKGEARGAIVGSKLYLITYAAPALHYFDAHWPKTEAIMASARLQ